MFLMRGSFLDDYLFNDLVGKDICNYSKNYKRTEKGIEIEVAGYNEKNLEVKLKGREIEIKGEREEKKIEMRYKLGEEIDLEKVRARVEDGLLSIDFEVAGETERKLL